MDRRLHNNSGFSLVEILVVVGIVAILAIVASTTYDRVLAHTRTQEAKVDLSAEYSAERNFYVTNLSYTLCLKQIGFQPTEVNSYYFTGFLVVAGATCGPTANYNCTSWDFSGGPAPAGGAVCDCTTTQTDANGTKHTDCNWQPKVNINTGVAINTGYAWNVTQTTFLIGAEGKILNPIGFGSTTKLDTWTIDHTKKLQNPISGQ